MSLGRLKDRLRGENASGLALALFAFAVYAYTAMPSIPSEDSGEIATSLYVLGIVHPTGYPLFTLLGHAWIDLPAFLLGGSRVIVRLNLLMAVLCAAATFLSYRLFLTFLREAFPAREARRRDDSPPSLTWACRLAAAGGALALAFSREVWTNAGSLEVYALHIFFLPLVTWLFLKAMPRAATPSPLSDFANRDRIFTLFAYVLGLSFSNHMMTVLLAPGFLFFFFSLHGFGERGWMRILRAVPPFVLGLSPYLYLPLRAAAKPITNWGDPETWHNLEEHVSAAQYRFKMFSNWEGAQAKTLGFFRDLPSDFGYIPFILAVIGLAALAWRARRLFVFSLLLFVVGFVYEANYDFPDLNFRLNAHFTTGLWAAVGIFVLARFTAGRLKGLGISAARWAAVLAVLAGAASLSANFPELDRHDEYAVEDYTRNVLASTEPGALLLTNEEWTLLFPAMYLQRVENFRPDVAILHPGAVLMSWNQEYIRRTTPGIFGAAPDEAQALFGLSKSVNEGGNAGDVASRRGTWSQVAHGLVRGNLLARPVHSSFILFFNENDFGNLAKDYPALPEGMTFRLFPDSFPTWPMPERYPVYHPIRAESEMGTSLRGFYPDVYYNRGVYEVGFLKDTAAAIRSFMKAQELQPGHAMSKDWLVKLGVWR
ncbi:MAG TPA: DUF2723 domain-containing protein [Fibrobacteria bacterium]|nr:DUF2723 domain-containing protein [Fibrobacteria bacterium]